MEEKKTQIEALILIIGACEGASNEKISYEETLYQIEHFAKEGLKSAQQGAVWVRASERLPGFKTPVKWRLDGIERNKGKVTVIYMANGESPAHLPDYEWYDESGTAAVREEDAASKEVIERIKDLQLSDIDAPVFTHTKEFRAHFSYIKGKLMDIIRAELGSSVGNDDDLMSFADWITEKGYWPASKGKWFGHDFLGTKTTAQIYELFNKRKEK